MHDRIIILDFGSQYTQLIARSVRELNVYCDILPFSKMPDLDPGIKGVILSGSPFSVLDENAPRTDLTPLLGEVPVLAVCYGAQYLAHHHGGHVARSDKREYGRAHLRLAGIDDRLLKGIEDGSQVWMSHGDSILRLPDGYDLLAGTKSIDVAIFRSAPADGSAPVYALQFHPEVSHSTQGSQLLENFLYDICGCAGDWTPASFVEETVRTLRETVGDDHVIMGLSGGVDSTVAAILLDRAIGDRLHCIFVDNGLLRKNEFDDVLHAYKDMGLNITGVRAADRFLSELDGVSDPETKRKIIGRVFIEVFQDEASKIENASWLGQGTIYPDVIESVSVHGPSVTIKSHHNVGGLPDILHLRVVEPLRMLFKDEVRTVGAELRIPRNILGRHPFPGPGLAIRILGEINAERVRILQEADHIFINGLKEAGLYDDVWQAGTILLDAHSVGVMGDERTYENVVALRAVTSRDGMTADWCHLPYDVLAEISNTIINNVKGINRVVYDISSKPPATIEWE